MGGVGGIVNEFAVPDVHPRVRDVLLGAAEIEQVAGLKFSRLTAPTPLQSAWISASRGMMTPRWRTSICMKPEQSRAGNFLPLVPPGRYEVTAEKTGFKKGTQEITVEPVSAPPPTSRWSWAR